MKKLNLFALLFLGIVAANAQYSVMINFSGTANGNAPRGSLTLANGVLYGGTEAGGLNNDGCIFSINKNGSGFKKIFDFNGTDGTGSVGTLVYSAGVLYGMTFSGGLYGHGTIFSMDSNGTSYKDLYDFDNIYGWNPGGSLTLSGGILYGMASAGGANSDGCLFSINTNGSNYKDIFDFNGTNGNGPDGTLVISGTVMYGMTVEGGANNKGCVFSINTNGSGYTDLLDFNTTNGQWPYGSLTLSTSGTILYGMTSNGGAQGYGVVFSIHTDGSRYKDLLDFTSTNGANPDGDLTLSGNTLYGMAIAGGLDAYGNVFSVDTNGSGYVDMYDFDYTHGSTPYGDVLLSGTELYGLADAGGSGSDGVLFKLSTCTMTTSISPIVNISCNGYNNGSLTAVPLNGSTPYTYAWTGGGTNALNSSLSIGSYTVTVSDNMGCSATAKATITQPTLLTVAVGSTTGVSCNGGANGSISMNVAGGTTPYTYNWSPNTSTSALATNLSSGTYTLTVVDKNGCSVSASANVTQPSALLIGITQINVNCNGGNNGSATATPSGGTSPYTYSWSGGGTNPSKTGLTVGTYTITVKDKNACSATASVIISQPGLLTIAANVISNVLCNGGSTGSASATPTGGTAPYTYLWSNSQTTPTITGLNATTYSVTVNDANGCSATASVTITQPGLLIASDSWTNITCNGANNGTATASVFGGTSPFTYSWSNAKTTTAITGLSIGTYTLNITDHNGCTASATATITQPTAITVSITPTNINCNGGNGSAIANPSGGTSPYTYSWTPSGNTNANATGLSVGTYTVTVHDNNGCTATASVTITQPALLTTTISVTNISCNGGNNGKLAANPSGGTPIYSYLWTPGGQTTATATGLSAGSYTLTVTDGHGCTATASSVITQPALLTDSIVTASTVNNKCANGTSGSAKAGVKGGTSPYTYLWSNGATTGTATGLSTGTFTVTVKDHNGCSGTASITITAPPAIRDSVVSMTGPTCNGGNNGSATVGVKGGTSPYTYAWSPNTNTTATASSLSSTSYTVTISDKNNCSAALTFTLTQPGALRDSISIATKVPCYGGTGSATVGVKGGASPYTYLWNPGGKTTATVTGLSVGTYSVTVTDKNGCTGTTAIANITKDAVKDSVTSYSCIAHLTTATVGVKGGTSPYTYLWSPSGGTKATMAGLLNATYTIKVTDKNGCTATVSEAFHCSVAPPHSPEADTTLPTCCKVALYPNPNTGQYTLSGLDKGMIIEMYDYTGRRITASVASNETMQFNISNQPNGIYLVRIINQEGVLVSQLKVVKTQ